MSLRLRKRKTNDKHRLRDAPNRCELLLGSVEVPLESKIMQQIGQEKGIEKIRTMCVMNQIYISHDQCIDQ